MSPPFEVSSSNQQGNQQGNQQRNDRIQRQPNQHARLNETEGEGRGTEEEEEKRKEEHSLQSAITSASHSQLSHILLDLCRHSKTAIELTRSHLCQPEVPVAVAIAVPAVSTSRNQNEASKKPKVLRSILKKRKDDTSSCSPSGKVSWSPPQHYAHPSPSLSGISLPPRSPSVAFSPVTSTSKTSSSNSSNSCSNSSVGSSISKEKSNKSKPSPAPEDDAHNSKKRKGPAPAPAPTPIRCRNCGSEYNITPPSSPNRDGPSTTVGENEGEVCVHHTGEREVQPSHAVWEDFDPDLHGDAWTLMEYEAFACGFRWSCCKREVGERGCVVAKRHEAAPVPLAMPMWKRVRR